MKSYTNFEQSKKLSEMLPLESADMVWRYNVGFMCYYDGIPEFIQAINHFELCNEDIPCWSLASLIKILHHNEKDIVSLSYGGYKDDKYILNWCLDYETEDGNYIKTFGDDSVDACVEMILTLHEKNLL